ncbi:hypothetical protein ACLIBH_03115 [Virgibacillus sp. W0430]|uniref:hypothetical protein n=1 Tax=Virgibacillus sp. W0430 TaxID=3391580 RepID=UPI003F46D22B
MNRHKYYVKIEEKEIRKEPLPDGTNYAILATENEVQEINNMFVNMENESKEALKHIFKPFNERSVDRERNKYDRNLRTVYERIYHLGTTETKAKIRKLGLF